MKYITHRRFKNKALCGEVNLPAYTELDCQDNIILYEEYAICFAESENAHQFFARNDDNNGMLRGKLTQAIQKKLAKRDKNYQDRWDKIWADNVCKSYKRKEYEDYWLWNNDFFNADIETLQYIADLVGA